MGSEILVTAQYLALFRYVWAKQKVVPPLAGTKMCQNVRIRVASFSSDISAMVLKIGPFFSIKRSIAFKKPLTPGKFYVESLLVQVLSSPEDCVA